MGDVYAVAMVKDEADVIEATVTRMLAEVDVVLIADNGSTDGTLELLKAQEYERLIVITDDEVGYYQSRKMTALAARAAELGAEWVVPFDADEVWRSEWGTIGDTLRALPDDEGIVSALVYDHVTTDIDDQRETDPTRRIAWHRPDALPLTKIAARPVVAVTIEQGNHGAHYPATSPNPVLQVRHFPYRSDAQFVRKVCNGAAAYAATDLPEDLGAHWRQWGEILRDSGEQVLIDEVYRKWFHSTDPVADGLTCSPV